MKTLFLPEARLELAESSSYYENRLQGLGLRFKNEIARVCARIAEDPLLWRERKGGYRRVNCPNFPFYVVYFIRKEAVVIAAVAHGHRLPEYWKHRIP